MRTRYTTTVETEPGGNRKLAWANQGRNFSDSREEAETKLKAILEGSSKSNLHQVFGENVGSLRVDKILCYDNGDASQTVWGPDNDPLTGIKASKLESA